MENMKYQVMPSLTAEEYDALKTDIAEHGVLVPVEIDEHGNILDGHHRVRACEELGRKDYPSTMRVGLSEEEKIEHALTLNLARRHLTREQRRDVVLTLRQQGWSSTRIAERLGVSDQTVLNDLSTSKFLEVELPDRTIGKDGKSRPALRPAIVTKSSSETRRALDALATLPSATLPDRLLDVKRLERINREYHAEQRAYSATGDMQRGRMTLLLGDMQQRGAEIPDASVDLIFTDPPYPEEFLPLWSELSRLAARVLKPDGLLASYTGQVYLPEVMGRLRAYPNN